MAFPPPPWENGHKYAFLVVRACDTPSVVLSWNSHRPVPYPVPKYLPEARQMSARCLPNIRRMGWDVRRKFAVCLPNCPPDFRRMSSNVRRIVLQNVRIEGPGGFPLNIRQTSANVRQIICQIVRRMNARLSVRKHPAENTADIRRTIR